MAQTYPFIYTLHIMKSEFMSIFLTIFVFIFFQVYHLVEGRSHEILFFDEELEEHQPFPTLEEALKVIDLHVGFNVELKWTMEMDDGTFELNNPFDMNTYVDKVRY